MNYRSDKIQKIYRPQDFVPFVGNVIHNSRFYREESRKDGLAFRLSNLLHPFNIYHYGVAFSIGIGARYLADKLF